MKTGRVEVNLKELITTIQFLRDRMEYLAWYVRPGSDEHETTLEIDAEKQIEAKHKWVDEKIHRIISSLGITINGDPYIWPTAHIEWAQVEQGVWKAPKWGAYTPTVELVDFGEGPRYRAFLDHEHRRYDETVGEPILRSLPEAKAQALHYAVMRSFEEMDIEDTN